jgi:hypothetical protein
MSATRSAGVRRVPMPMLPPPPVPSESDGSSFSQPRKNASGLSHPSLSRNRVEVAKPA